MTKQKSLIGMELDCTLRTIEAGQINSLYRAFHQPNPFAINKAKDTINKEQFNHIPPFLVGNLINLPSIYKILSLNINNTLLSRESIVHHLPIKIGDIITVKTFLKNAYEQQASSNPIGFIILESVGCHNNELAFYCERVIAVRGGFQRGRP